MNDELKNILDEFMNFDFNSQSERMEINEYERNILKDYITNLQQELEEYKDTETYSKRFLYKANKDRLNANLELVKELEDYKSRTEKAVEIINNDSKYTDDDFEGRIFQNDLLRILEGKDNE